MGYYYVLIYFKRTQTILNILIRILILLKNDYRTNFDQIINYI